MGKSFFSISNATPVVEGATAYFTVSRSGDLSREERISYQTLQDTARYGYSRGNGTTDFRHTSGNLFFGKGERNKTISVDTWDDIGLDIEEMTETFNVKISAAAYKYGDNFFFGQDNGINVITDSLGVGYIYDNDSPSQPINVTGEEVVSVSPSIDSPMTDYLNSLTSSGVQINNINANGDVSLSQDQIQNIIDQVNLQIDNSVNITDNSVDNSTTTVINNGIMAGEITTDSLTGIDNSVDNSINNSFNQVGVAVNRFYNMMNGTHYYSSDQAEINRLTNNQSGIYINEGVAFEGLPEGEGSTMEGFFNVGTGQTLMTANEYEINKLNKTIGWSYTGEKFNVSLGMSDTATQAVNRFFNTGNGTHLFTMNETEMQMLDNNSAFINEGVAYYI